MNLRIILTSARALDVIVAALAGVALALAFPKANLPWLAPLGAAALFWLWHTASWKRAFFLGWFAGAIFFAISFSWFGYTVGSYLGPWAPIVVIGPAIIEGLFIGLAGIAASLAFHRAPALLAPLAAAAAFPVFEWLRSVGWTALPFAQLGYSQANTPLALFAAYIGTYGVTFVVCIIGAYIADALVRRTPWRCITAACVIAIAWAMCWLAWPARHVVVAPAIRAAAVQGNITQSLKWTPGAVSLAINRYSAMTRKLQPLHPQLIVWPETVIPEILNHDKTTEQRFSQLARDVHATLVVGAQELAPEGIYNALYIFGPDGNLENIYQKRQLVPFAESLPGKKYLGWLPYITALAGTFASGTVDGTYPIANTETTYRQSLLFAPMICWESAFADLAHNQIRNGAQLFVIATDDAWFGESAGPLIHAQIAQLRAIENGTWIVRAAATGISGIIAPTGAYVIRTKLDEQTTVTGNIGPSSKTLFARVGPNPIILVFALLYLALVFAGTRLRRGWQWSEERLTPSRSHGWRE